MPRSQVLIRALIAMLGALTACSAAPQKPYSHEDWAESQHPPSDTAPLPQGCNPLKYSGGSHDISAFVRSPGNWCVVHDFVQRKRIDRINGSTVGSPGVNGVLSFFEYSNVDIDLRAHLISAEPFDNAVGVFSIKVKNKVLRVHNGRIVTPGLKAVGVFMAPNVDIDFGANRPPEDDALLVTTGWNLEAKKFNTIPWNYQPPTRYTAENLTIHSGGRGIVMSGADNVIRNNTIEVDGKVAVYMYGPRPVIEGNTFIVHLDSKDQTTLPAILKLRDADGAIIRNNRFVVRAGPFSAKAEAAINLLMSKNVVIENNTVEDTAVLVRKDEVSSTVERGNQVK
jgi:Right handed beta helix region